MKKYKIGVCDILMIVLIAFACCAMAWVNGYGTASDGVYPSSFPEMQKELCPGGTLSINNGTLECAQCDGSLWYANCKAPNTQIRNVTLEKFWSVCL